MIVIYRCENPKIVEFLREHGIDFDIEGRDKHGDVFYGYYKTDELDYLLLQF